MANLKEQCEQSPESVIDENESKNAQPSSENECDNEPEEHASHEKDSNKVRKVKKGIIYISNIPKHMNVTRIREILGAYGKIGRVFLQPEKVAGTKPGKRKRRPRHFTEGWVEFERKRTAKQVVEFLNNTQISTRKRSQFYDHLWSMKYLPRFKWYHLTERMNYEQAVYKQRLATEVAQARREATYFQNNLDKSEFIKKKENKRKT